MDEQELLESYIERLEDSKAKTREERLQEITSIGNALRPYIGDIHIGVKALRMYGPEDNFIGDIDVLIEKIRTYKTIRKPQDDRSRSINEINIKNISTSNSNANVTVENLLNIEINNFIRDIGDNTVLSDKDKEEIISVVKELEKIEPNEKRTKKWSKVKPKIEWILTKGPDIALNLLKIVFIVMENQG